MILRYLLEIAGNNDALIYTYEDKFRHQFNTMDKETFDLKWRITFHFLMDLKKIPKPQYTKLLRVSTTWGMPEYSVFEFAVSDIEHNPELIKFILSISAIWNYPIDLKKRRVEETESITAAIEKTFNNANNSEYYKRIYKSYCEDDYMLWYIYIEDECSKHIIDDKDKSSNMRKDIYTINVLMY